MAGGNFMDLDPLQPLQPHLDHWMNLAAEYISLVRFI